MPGPLLNRQACTGPLDGPGADADSHREVLQRQSKVAVRHRS